MGRFRKQGFEITDEEIPGEDQIEGGELGHEPRRAARDDAGAGSGESPRQVSAVAEAATLEGDVTWDPWDVAKREPGSDPAPPAQPDAAGVDDFWADAAPEPDRPEISPRFRPPVAGSAPGRLASGPGRRAIERIRAHRLAAVIGVALVAATALVLSNRSSEPAQLSRAAGVKDVARTGVARHEADPRVAGKAAVKRPPAERHRSRSARRHRSARQREKRRRAERAEARRRHRRHSRHEKGAAATPAPEVELAPEVEPAPEPAPEPTYEAPPEPEPTYEPAPEPAPAPTPPSDEFGIEP